VNGYAATARIERSRPRLAMPSAADDLVRHAPIQPSLPAQDGRSELADTRIHDALIDRIDAIHDRWSQLTFYLFDPDGWR
jgi:hypothetical protein